MKRWQDYRGKTPYNNSINIEMKLFNPKGDVLQLGAKRHEKGQRANEILRKVNLTKPFYVSLHEVSNENFSNFNEKHYLEMEVFL